MTPRPERRPGRSSTGPRRHRAGRRCASGCRRLRRHRLPRVRRPAGGAHGRRGAGRGPRAGAPPRGAGLTCAGRTDAGVHALGPGGQRRRARRLEARSTSTPWSDRATASWPRPSSSARPAPARPGFDARRSAGAAATATWCSTGRCADPFLARHRLARATSRSTCGPCGGPRPAVRRARLLGVLPAAARDGGRHRPRTPGASTPAVGRGSARRRAGRPREAPGAEPAPPRSLVRDRGGRLLPPDGPVRGGHPGRGGPGSAAGRRPRCGSCDPAIEPGRPAGGGPRVTLVAGALLRRQADGGYCMVCDGPLPARRSGYACCASGPFPAPGGVPVGAVHASPGTACPAVPDRRCLPGSPAEPPPPAATTAPPPPTAPAPTTIPGRPARARNYVRTYSPKPAEVTRAWHVVDADGLVLGRLATEVARSCGASTSPSSPPTSTPATT